MLNVNSLIRTLRHAGNSSAEVAARIGCTQNQLAQVRAGFIPASPEQQRLHDRIISGLNQLVKQI